MPPTKKSAKKASKGSPKPALKKSTSKKVTKAAGKKPVKKAASTGKSSSGLPELRGGPSRITTGTGASPEQIGRELVNDFNAGKAEVTTKLWSPQLVSIEGMGMQWKGMKSVEAKNASWSEQNVVRGASAEGPYIGSTGFAVKFRMDIEERASGKRVTMEEVGVYTVKNGKIVQEEFMYGNVYPSPDANEHFGR